MTDLTHLSRQERFYFDVGEAISMYNMRSFINLETLEVETHSGEYDFDITGMEDTAQEAIEYPEKFMHIETAEAHQAFNIMENFVEVIDDKAMQQRLTDALTGRKPFAKFNHLVHTTFVREQWFDFKNQAYTQMAKEWIGYNADEGLKEKIKALPADTFQV